jgi:hypothetical protein
MPAHLCRIKSSFRLGALLLLLIDIWCRNFIVEERICVAPQVKSRKRVQDHGEVFTNEREVNAMLDMVKQETERIDSRFLEPACGNGNFLAEVLRRKLAVVSSRYRRSPEEYMRYVFVAVSSIYGVDILQDNVEECRKRLFSIVEASARAALHSKVDEESLLAISYVLDKNILCGDALTLKTKGDEPIIFSEWSFVTGNLVKRRDYRLDELLSGHDEQLSFFGESGSDATEWEYDEEIDAFIPTAIQEWPPMDYREVRSVG